MNRSNEVLRDGEYEEHRGSWRISLLGRKIAGLERKKDTQQNTFIGADLNGHNTLWGYIDVDSRGTAIEEFILANNLFINNSLDAPLIFTRNTSKGWPDLSLCTQQVVGEIANWEVLEEPSLSDH
ncbi:hypothetical protein AVEN_82289-1 [Araneus ventricosus]|uniref:Endonuclease/exonuclease/phosphatase domain-containing protein n=1 Tax=Araneus ventricosus TaxID=182803 RepID=A0A4Y2PER0_ARAVE|nr:hypothetical protein AVEN_82289-1 [Araneus ventricosus]